MIIGIIYGILICFSLFFGYRCTAIDPTDPIVYLERKAFENK